RGTATAGTRRATRLRLRGGAPQEPQRLRVWRRVEQQLHRAGERRSSVHVRNTSLI
ncbi:unnamed protein product, partial [Tetraodon nigroviridis]